MTHVNISMESLTIHFCFELQQLSQYSKWKGSCNVLWSTKGSLIKFGIGFICTCIWGAVALWSFIGQFLTLPFRSAKPVTLAGQMLGVLPCCSSRPALERCSNATVGERACYTRLNLMRVNILLTVCLLRGTGLKNWGEGLLSCIRGSCIIPLSPVKPGGGMMLTGVLIDRKFLMAPEWG